MEYANHHAAKRTAQEEGMETPFCCDSGEPELVSGGTGDAVCHTPSASFDAAAEQCRENVDFAREAYGDIFPSEPIVLTAADGDSSPVKGKGKWDRLVALPFIGPGENALNKISGMWQCPDTVPYADGKHIVWEFPQFRETKPQNVGHFSGVYPAGFFPARFDEHIQSLPGTAYNPDCNKVSGNLDANEYGVLWYLGNYFPRSFVETFCIYDYVFSIAFDELFGHRSELTICDIGIGTGGATYGLIWALRKRLMGNAAFKRINVIGLDGNREAIKVFCGLKTLIENEWKIDFTYTTECVRLTSESLIPEGMADCRADFVISSKSLQEICHDPSELKDLYSRYFAEAQTIVSRNGLVSILEINNPAREAALKQTLKTANGKYAIASLPKSEEVVWREKFSFISTRAQIHPEDVLFAVIGPLELTGKCPKLFPQIPDGVPAPGI